ncbi:hypothetical protein ACFLUY_02945 [Chloroflexota bacterium]
MKQGKYYRVLAVPILLSLLLVVIPATPVLAAPVLSTSPESGAVGTKVTVTIVNFDSYIGDDIYLFFDEQGITNGSMTVPQSGSFSIDFIIPDWAEPGQHRIRAESELGSTLAFSLFTILKTRITINGNAGVVDSILRINGQGFYANRMISFYYDSRLLGSEPASDIGEFSYSFKIPDSTAGNHIFEAKNIEGHSVKAKFRVLPSISLDAASATADSIIAVSGSGFGSESSIDITFRNDEVAYAKTSVFGSFKNTLFNVPEMAPGTYTVVALDEDGEKGETTFTIITELIPEATPEVTVEPTVEDEPVETNSSWGTYALIGAGVLVVGILIFLLRRKTAYQ